MNRILLIAATVLLASRSVLALDPNRAVTQARLAVWTSDAGLPQNTIGAIVQTRDGYLWLGTEEGLARFDGLRFAVSDRQNAPALRSAFISSLFEAPDGTLWIGTYGGGLARSRNGRIEAFHPEVLGTERVREMHAAADGALLVATAGGGVLRIDGERVTRFTTRDGLPSDRIWAFEGERDGGVWISTHGGGVVLWKDGRVQQRITTAEGLPNDYARTLFRDSDRTLWIGTDGGGVAAWRDGRIVSTITTRDGLPSDLIRALHRDRDGSLWIGTDAGLSRWRGGRAETLGLDEWLPSPVVRTIFEDREGSLWIGTTAGLARLSDTRFLSFTQKEGLSAGVVRAILEDRAGRIQVGTEGGGLCTIVAGTTQCTKTLPHDVIYALAEGRDGSLWLGTDGGGVARLRDGKLVETIDEARSGIRNNRIRALVETDAGLWVSTTGGLALVRNGRAMRVKELDDQQIRPLLAQPDGALFVGTDGRGLWRVSADGLQAARIAGTGLGLHSDRVFSLATDGRGGIWIGTSGGGLARLDLASGAVRSLTRRNGLHDDVVFQIVDDGTDLWLTSNRGLYRVSRDRLLAAMGGKQSDLSGTVYGASDGMPSAECNAGSPAAMRARDGRLWIATARGIAVIHPEAIARNTLPPPVHVEGALIDGSPAPGGALRIPPGTQRLEIRYTALGLRAPERVRFRYILDGYDRDWVDAGTGRAAHYTKLAAGRYTFRVTATNEDGVRSTGEARLALDVAPRWFETWWARLLGVLLAAAAVWAALRLRVAAVRARKNEELAGLAAQLEDANVRLRALSYADGLTGVANRRRFDEALEEAWVASAEKAKPLSLVLIDLDHFKTLNDSHGHQEGDEALRAVATLLRDRTESHGGLAARFGGEEFAWLLPGYTLDAARGEAESFRELLRDAAIRHEGTATGILTASLGVSSSNGDRGQSPLALVAAADAALYRAKSRGRDRVETQA